MNSTIYECCKCHKVFYNPKDNQPECPNCIGHNLTPLEEWEPISCLKCAMEYDVSTLKMHGNLGRIEPGIVLCKYDETELKW